MQRPALAERDEQKAVTVDSEVRMALEEALTGSAALVIVLIRKSSQPGSAVGD
jgi:hypothetical protein